MCDRIDQKKYRLNDKEIVKRVFGKCLFSCISGQITITGSVLFLTALLILKANVALAWSVNAHLTYVLGLPDAYSAAELGCALSSGGKRIAGVSFISPEEAYVACESYDEGTAQWWWWREAFIAAEPDDLGFFMDAGEFENEDQGESCSGSKHPINSQHPINLINGNKYKIYTDITDTMPSGISRPGFIRYYNSQSTLTSASIGNKWTHSYDRRMIRNDALRTGDNIYVSSAGEVSDPFQSSLYTTRQAACESGIWEITDQSSEPGPGSLQNLQAFKYADAQWVNDECRIFVDGHYRANNSISTHGIYRDVGSKWDDYLRFYRPDGNVIKFQKTYSGTGQEMVTSWEDVFSAGFELDEIDVTPAPVENEVVIYRINYVLTDPNNVKETYDHSGELLYVDYPNGVRETITYSNGTVSRVDNSLGQYIDIQYNDDGYIDHIVDDSSRVWQYRYLNTNLVEVINPDLSSVKYHYENSNYPGALTGVTDERNIRVSTFDYYQDGLAKSSYLGRPEALPELRIDNVSVMYGALSNTVTNSRGYQSTYHYSDVVLKGLLMQYDGPECDACADGSKSYDYDIDLDSPDNSTLNLLSKTEYGQNTTYEDHDENGNPGIVTEAVATPEERTTSYTYDPRYQSKVKIKTEPSVYAAGSKVTTYTYDDFGNTTSITVNGYRPDATPVFRSHSFEYNGPYHQLSEIDGPRTDVDDIYNIIYYPDSESEGNNRARVETVIAPLGVVLYDNITYTPTGKRLSYTTGTNLQADFTYYPGNDRLETQTLTDLASGETRTTRWTYIPTGEVESITQGYATHETTTLTFEYDDARRLYRIYDSFYNYIEYKLDTEGNVIHENIYDESNILLKTLDQSFDAYNRMDISTQVNETHNHDFSPDGTLDLEADGKSVVTDYRYDGLRRLTSITQDLGGTDPSSANALTLFGYDMQDNLVSVTDPNGGQTSYIYDDLGNLISLSSPDTGTSNYKHDEAGNTASMTDAKGQVFNYSYDALGRLTLADAPGTSDDVIYVYDTCENGAGKLCSVNRDVVTLSYGYTAFGDIKSSTQAVTTFPSYEQAMSQMSYRYDAVGRIRDMVYPGGNKVTYTYDAAGNVYNVILNEGEKNLVTAALYYPFGPERFVTRDNGSSIFGYMDQAYRSFITGHGGYFYDVINYDANGNPETFYSSEGSRDHGYDALDRLDTSSGPYGSRDYGYDINGNRTSKQVDSVTNSYSYDAGTNRMNTNAGSSVLLDANGNTRNIDGMTISYTSDNRVSNISDNAFYTYNGYGERTMKALLDNGSAGTYGFKHKTVYVYGLGGKLVAETGSSGRVKQEYVYLNDELLATIVYEPSGGESILNADMDNDGAIGIDDFMIWYFNHYNTGDVSRDVNEDGHIDMNDAYLVQNCALSGGTAAGCTTSSYNRSVYYAHNDHLGTPHMLSDETGVAVWSAVYDPFGKATVNEDLDADSNRVTLNIRFPGQYYDIESGLHYNYFRYYDPVTGRYITSDPIGLTGGANTYIYVYNNPFRYVDPLGLDVTVCLYPATHIGMSVNSSETYGRRTDGTSSLIEILGRKDVPGEVSEDDKTRPVDCTKTKTTPEQDKKFQEYIDTNIKNPGKYNLTGRSCVDFVRDAYENILNIPLSNTNFPTRLYSDIFHHNNKR